MSSSFRVESDLRLESDWMPPEAFTMVYSSSAAAVATAIEGVEDPATEEVRVIDTSTGEVVWRSTEHEYE
jgi:hypothetical protein